MWSAVVIRGGCGVAVIEVTACYVFRTWIRLWIAIGRFDDAVHDTSSVCEASRVGFGHHADQDSCTFLIPTSTPAVGRRDHRVA